MVPRPTPCDAPVRPARVYEDPRGVVAVVPHLVEKRTDGPEVVEARLEHGVVDGPRRRILPKADVVRAARGERPAGGAVVEAIRVSPDLVQHGNPGRRSACRRGPRRRAPVVHRVHDCDPPAGGQRALSAPGCPSHSERPHVSDPVDLRHDPTGERDTDSDAPPRPGAKARPAEASARLSPPALGRLQLQWSSAPVPRERRASQANEDAPPTMQRQAATNDPHTRLRTARRRAVDTVTLFGWMHAVARPRSRGCGVDDARPECDQRDRERMPVQAQLSSGD